MTRSHLYRFGLALAATAGLAVCTARGQQGAGQKVGEKLDEAGAAIRRGVDKAGETVKDQYHRAKASINAMGIEGRVYGRLRWDKALEKASIEVTAVKDGTVTLTGMVADASAKAKAVQLATDTVGVAKVVDALTAAKLEADR